MKRTFAYLALTLCLCTFLSGCHERMDGGNVANSPAPAIESPVIPSPDLELPATASPDVTDNQTGPTERQSPRGSGEMQPTESARPSEQTR